VRNKTVFLDRDGVICEDIHHLHKVEQLELINGTKEAIRALKDNGYLVIVITNQSVVARGLVDVFGVITINNHLNNMVDNLIDDFLFCPHLPTDDCLCRKPNIQLIKNASLYYDVDIFESYIVGDKSTDIQAGYNAGLKTIAVRTGYGEMPEYADYKADNLLDAVRKIICK
jgi:D-glycero-D-manno-heptose 1,7-bisphosphate phosphatase